MGVVIPSSLRKRYADHTWDFVYSGVPNAVTFRLWGAEDGDLYLKLTTPGWWPSLRMEEERLRWAQGRLPVPAVVEAGSDGTVDWLITEALPGLPGTHRTLTVEPRRLVRILAEGLRRFHEAPVRACPFDFTLDTAVALTRDRLDAGLIDAERDFHPEFTHLTPSDAVSRLELDRPSGEEDLVVCHGDYCLPNVLIDEGRAVGFVDLAELGVADRWWDLAVATWSLTWNLGAGYEELFLEAYGIDPDPERMEYYRLLYDVVS